MSQPETPREACDVFTFNGIRYCRAHHKLNEAGYSVSKRMAECENLEVGGNGIGNMKPARLSPIMNATEVLQQLEVFWNIPTPINGVVEIPNIGRDDLANLFGFLGFDTGVEIGTERGFYAEILCKANPDLCLYCIDPYEAYRGYREHTSQEKLDNLYNEALGRYTCS